VSTQGRPDSAGVLVPTRCTYQTTAASVTSVYSSTAQGCFPFQPPLHPTDVMWSQVAATAVPAVSHCPATVSQCRPVHQQQTVELRHLQHALLSH